jgi:hypothetical protein
MSSWVVMSWVFDRQRSRNREISAATVLYAMDEAVMYISHRQPFMVRYILPVGALLQEVLYGFGVRKKYCAHTNTKMASSSRFEEQNSKTV